MNTQPFVLILLSAAQRLRLNDGTEVTTGFWAEELVVPWQILRKAGWRLQVVTPGGVPPLIDPESLDPSTLGGDHSRAAYLCNAVRQITGLRTPLDLDALTGKDLDTLIGVFIPGGNGPLMDLCQAPGVDRLLRHCVAAAKPIATLCHGTAALLATCGGADRSPFCGQRVTCFSAAEESATPLAGRWPYTLENRLRQEGFRVSTGAPWQSHIATDNFILSGQNPASAATLTHVFIERLTSTPTYKGNNMNADALKKMAAEAALRYIQPGMVVGVGTGSTTNFFIAALGAAKIHVDGYVASSIATENRLKAQGLNVLDLNATGDIPVYVDGADEADPHFRLIKGGGGALTREKIVASAARLFICIADVSKDKPMLGKFPLPVEVIPFARSFVARQLVKLGGSPTLRNGVTTDNGNVILDVTGLDLSDPLRMEESINAIPGVLDNGIFAHRRADVMLFGSADGVIERKA
ncbi:Ribose-5-phosphate isomerase A [Acidithiobacillus ferrivorans SS3]|uniref:Ribose-5-phosphate isomerase A n=1 Tax=Acidithiobacillus ferrivorans SS3 TaxID=743299 RepID=G0JNF3_9PROT|nr:Ribose-5-phosphate isomerase A [Acidithiobacillus ferrivorans SS3]